MSKIYPIKMNLSYILALFNANNKMSFIKNGSEYVLFEVYSLKNAKQLEDLFLSKANTKRNIITNNQGKKPLIMSVEFSDNSIRNMWRFKIFQRGSKGIVLDTFQTIDSIPIELQTLLRPLEESFRNSNDLVDVYNHINKKEAEILSLTKNDLNIFLSRSLLTSFEIKQFLYSYNKDVLDYYDFNVERIDDKETYDSAVESNNNIESLKVLYERVAEKHKIE